MRSTLPPPPPAHTSVALPPTTRGVRAAFQTLISGALLVLAIGLRPGAALGLIVVGAAMVGLERLVPRRRQRVLRAGWQSDVVHFLVNNLFTTVLLLIGIVTIGLPLRALTPPRWRAAVAQLPAGARFLFALLVFELFHYGAHRLAHSSPTLWRFHKVHHSATEMDWLAAGRLHPVDQAFTQLAAVVPLLALGVTRGAFGAYVLFGAFQAIFVHANVRLRFGFLRYLIATPQFHHWHHGNEAAAYNTNFAAQLPLFDALFGTLRLPGGGTQPAWPSCYGLDEALPNGYVAQLAWPLRRKESHPKATRQAER